MDFQTLQVENTVELDDLHYALESYGYTVESPYCVLDMATESAIMEIAEEADHDFRNDVEYVKKLTERISKAPDADSAMNILRSASKLNAYYRHGRTLKTSGKTQQYRSDDEADATIHGIYSKRATDEVRKAGKQLEDALSKHGIKYDHDDETLRSSDNTKAVGKSIIRHGSGDIYSQIVKDKEQIRKQKNFSDYDSRTIKRLQDRVDTAERVSRDADLAKLKAEAERDAALKAVVAKDKTISGQQRGINNLKSKLSETSKTYKTELERGKKELDSERSARYDAEKYGDDQASRADAAELSNKKLKTGIKAGVIALAIAAAAIGGGLFLKKRREKAKARKAELTRKAYFESKGISEDKRHSYLAKIQSDAISDASKIVNKLKADKNLRASGVEIIGSKSGNTITVIKPGSNTDVVSSTMKALRDKWVDELEAGVLSIQYTSDHTGLKIEAN